MFHGEFTSPPRDCVLAAIYDIDSIRGAQYAIPEGKIAITQGYFQVDDYIDHCHFDDADTDNGTVTDCDDPYYEYFRNYDGSHVPDDDDDWVEEEVEFPMDDGKLIAGMGSDGLLRPIKITDTDSYDGAVFECCPQIKYVCNVEPEADT